MPEFLTDISIPDETFTPVEVFKQLFFKSLPAGEPLAAASVDALGQ